MTTRRSFLSATLALGAAPAIVRAESLMPLVRPIWAPLPGLGIRGYTNTRLKLRGVQLNENWMARVEPTVIARGSTGVITPQDVSVEWGKGMPQEFAEYQRNLNEAMRDLIPQEMLRLQEQRMRQLQTIHRYGVVRRYGPPTA